MDQVPVLVPRQVTVSADAEETSHGRTDLVGNVFAARRM
jgi:hypothetical protein